MRVHSIILAYYAERACFTDAAKFCARKMTYDDDLF